MARKEKNKNKSKEGKQENGSRKANSSHKAQGKDPVRVLRNVIQASGLAEGEIVAKEMDGVGLPGSSTLEILKTQHQEIRAEGVMKWVTGPAKWMERVLQSAKKKSTS